VPAFHPRTQRLCAKRSPLFSPNSGPSAVGCELSPQLSPLFATLTSHVKYKSFVCHSYEKHGGWGVSTDTAIQRRPLVLARQPSVYSPVPDDRSRITPP
jgi:hypothetical protein